MLSNQHSSFLESFISFEKRPELSDFSLKPINSQLLNKGYSKGFKNITYLHVAGSKGKGSVSTMLSLYLQKIAPTGRYTSPHIHQIKERFWANGHNISDTTLNNLIKDLQTSWLKNTKKTDITYFDILTALALKYFTDKQVKYAVMEVGIGGKLDSTNIIDAKIAILTKVEKEHTAILGDSLEQILQEQLGILKANEHLIIGHQSPEVYKILAKKLANRPNTHYLRDQPQDFCNSLQFTNLIQSQNAQLSALALKTLLKEQFNQQLFLQTIDNFQLIGRFQKQQISNKEVIFDMAHTSASIQNLLTSLQNHYPANQNYQFLISIMKDKQIPTMLKHIKQFLTPKDTITFTKSHPIRSAETSTLQNHIPQSNTEENHLQAFNTLLKNPNKNPIIVTGSHFLVSDLLPN